MEIATMGVFFFFFFFHDTSVCALFESAVVDRNQTKLKLGI